MRDCLIQYFAPRRCLVEHIRYDNVCQTVSKVHISLSTSKEPLQTILSAESKPQHLLTTVPDTISTAYDPMLSALDLIPRLTA